MVTNPVGTSSRGNRRRSREEGRAAGAIGTSPKRKNGKEMGLDEASDKHQAEGPPERYAATEQPMINVVRLPRRA